MPKRTLNQQLPHTPEQLYNMVSDIEQYPSFIPWCKGARILKREGNQVTAELLVRYQAISGKYTSQVTFHPEDKKIEVNLAEGPLKKLYNFWHFQSHDQGTAITFTIDLVLQSSFLNIMLEGMFDKAVEKMMTAFKERAAELYKASA